MSCCWAARIACTACAGNPSCMPRLLRTDCSAKRDVQAAAALWLVNCQPATQTAELRVAWSHKTDGATDRARGRPPAPSPQFPFLLRLDVAPGVTCSHHCCPGLRGRLRGAGCPGEWRGLCQAELGVTAGGDSWGRQLRAIAEGDSGAGCVGWAVLASSELFAHWDSRMLPHTGSLGFSDAAPHGLAASVRPGAVRALTQMVEQALVLTTWTQYVSAP
eukprot:364546-Chlamydomonas_euryale.AAC.17